MPLISDLHEMLPVALYAAGGICVSLILAICASTRKGKPSNGS